MVDIVARMEGLQISQPAPATHFRHQAQGEASVYKIKVRPGQKIYRYDVEIIRTDLNKIITRGGSDEGQRSLFRRLCHDLVLAVYNRTGRFGGGDQLIYVYDCKKNLFTNIPVNLSHSTSELQPGDMNQFCRDFLRNSTATVQIQRSEAFETDISDISKALQPDVGTQANRDIRMFLELLTSQQVVNDGSYDVIGMGKIFEKKAEPYREGLEFRAGLSKGVRIIINDNGQPPVPALVADAKKSAFYKMQPLVQTANEFSANRSVDWKRFMHFYRGVRCYLSYAPSRSVVIAGPTDGPVGDISVQTTDGQQIGLRQFYHDRYQVNIQNPQWPGIRVDGNRDAVFPLDVLIPLPNQRIPLQRMTDNLSRELLRLNTVDVSVRVQNINNQLRNILGGAAQQFMKNFGVIVENGTNDVKIGVRQAPTIEYGRNATVEARGANWFKDASRLSYIDPAAKIPGKWAVVFDRGDDKLVKNFAQDITNIGRQKGMQIQNPEVYPLQQFGSMDKMFEKLAGEATRFIMYIDDIREKSHGLLKIFERKFKVITQHVTFKNAAGGMATKTNILHKMNCKLFGLCYKPRIEQIGARLELDKKEIFVIGMDVAHPAPATPHQLYSMRQKQINYQSFDPSVVGISANYAKNIHSFVGDYFYQPSRREAIDPDSLRVRAQWLVTQLKKNITQPPKILFIFRDGVSEGQIPMVVNDELPAIRQGCADAQFKPKIVLVIVSKRHNKRFWVKGNNRAEDTAPGSVIDTKIVRADVKEFYMQSHARLKGTVKIPQYVVPIDEVGLSTDELEAFVNCLCHSHQIVPLGVSLPEPVYQAHELAKRGKNNYEELKLKYPNVVPRDPENPQLLNYQQLTNLLGYAQATPMFNTRFTA